MLAACSRVLHLQGPLSPLPPPLLHVHPAPRPPRPADKSGRTPLHSALLSGNKALVGWFMQTAPVVGSSVPTAPRQTLDYRLLDKAGSSVLLLAAMFGWWDVLQVGAHGCACIACVRLMPCSTTQCRLFPLTPRCRR